MYQRYSTIETARLQELLSFLKENYGDTITMATLEQRTLMNRNKIDAWFRRQFGMKAIKYLRHLRMTKARALVLETNLPIGDIANHVGYVYDNNFMAAFKRFWGVTPESMRRNSEA